MNNLNLKKIAEALIETFFDAGTTAEKMRHHGVKVTIKADKSPVTDGDLAVDEILRKKIENLTPNIPIVSEETVRPNEEINDKNFWLVDPIDGTRDYLRKKDEYTINAALIANLRPVLGIIYAPAKKRLFYSYGKNLSFEISDGKHKILDCRKKSFNEIIGLENSGETPKEVLDIYERYKVTKKLKIGSSLKFCILASGEADIYAAKARAFEWDIAAGHAILDHAGGSVTTHDEKKILYGKKNYKNLSIVAKRLENLEK